MGLRPASAWTVKKNKEQRNSSSNYTQNLREEGEIDILLKQNWIERRERERKDKLGWQVGLVIIGMTVVFWVAGMIWIVTL